MGVGVTPSTAAGRKWAFAVTAVSLAAVSANAQATEILGGRRDLGCDTMMYYGESTRAGVGELVDMVG